MAANLPAEPGFVPILTEPAVPFVAPAPTPASVIEVKIASAVVCVPPAVEAARVELLFQLAGVTEQAREADAALRGKHVLKMTVSHWAV